MPVLKCDKDGCHYETTNEVAMTRHVIKEELENLKPAQPEEKPKPRHRTVDEARGFLACPECRKSFVEAFKEDPKLAEEVGLVKPPEEETEEETPKKRRFPF